MNKNHFITEFGFCDLQQFINSLIRPKLLNFTLPLTAIGSFIQFIFGVQPIVLVAFVALLSIELISGIGASILEGKKITSKRMKAFLLMLFVWLTILFILNTFKSFTDSKLISSVFGYLFDIVLIYVNIIYFKSIWENIGRISNKKKEFKKLSNIFSKKLEEVTND